MSIVPYLLPTSSKAFFILANGSETVLIKDLPAFFREEIKEADIAEFNHYGNVFSVLFFVTLKL